MKKDCDDFLAREEKRKLRFCQGSAKGNVSNLLSEVLEQDEEIELYKSRLKELEAAFYYNLELISERDLELTVLEKQLGTESEKLQAVIRERHELEDLVKIIDEKNSRKIQQLETRLTLKEGEIKDLQRENAANVRNLKRLIDDVKQQQEKKIYKISRKYEIEKKELIKRYQEEIEEKEKYYLLEIDSLAGRLEQVCKEKDRLAAKEEENINLKYHLQDAERHFIEKENQYLEKIRKMSNSSKRKLSREVQCNFRPEGAEKIIQARPDVATADAQTTRLVPDAEDQHLRRIKFLQEQNEVLKCVIKDLKRNRDTELREPGQPPGCECSAIRTEIEQVNKKFENEINNIKKILQEELKQRAEEDAVIQNLETSVTRLKDKLLLRMQDKFHDFEGEDSRIHTYSREIQNEIQVKLLEKSLTEKIDSLVTATEGEMRQIHEKLEKLKNDCAEEMEEFVKLQEQPKNFRSESLLENIRLEMQKLENKINYGNKRNQIFETRVEFPKEIEGASNTPAERNSEISFARRDFTSSCPSLKRPEDTSRKGSENYLSIRKNNTSMYENPEKHTAKRTDSERKAEARSED